MTIFWDIPIHTSREVKKNTSDISMKDQKENKSLYRDTGILSEGTPDVSKFEYLYKIERPGQRDQVGVE